MIELIARIAGILFICFELVPLALTATHWVTTALILGICAAVCSWLAPRMH